IVLPSPGLPPPEPPDDELALLSSPPHPISPANTLAPSTAPPPRRSTLRRVTGSRSQVIAAQSISQIRSSPTGSHPSSAGSVVVPPTGCLAGFVRHVNERIRPVDTRSAVGRCDNPPVTMASAGGGALPPEDFDIEEMIQGLRGWVLVESPTDHV